jgi:type I restriction enzyme S subunit
MNAVSNDWQTSTLGDIGRSLIGLTYEPADVARTGTLVLRSSNIQGGQLTFDDNVFVSCAIPDRIRVRSHDILICVRNGSRNLIGKSVMLDERVVGQTFGAFMAVYRSDLNPYLQYFFQSVSFKRQIDEHLGATINQITNGSLNSFEVSLPSSEDRIAIVSCLSSVDQLISALEGLLAKANAVALGVRQQLLTGRTRLPGFDEPWQKTELGRVGQFIKGRGVRRDDVRPNGIPCIRYGELYTSFTDYTFHAQSFVDDRVALTALPLRFGDALFAASGETRDEIGKCVAYVGPIPAVAGGDVIVLRGTSFNPIYLAMLANSPSVVNQKSRAGQGDTVAHINSGALAAIEIALPSRKEQDAIAAVALAADKAAEAVRARLAKIKDLKSGMMQELLTGRTHLPIGEGVT